MLLLLSSHHLSQQISNGSTLSPNTLSCVYIQNRYVYSEKNQHQLPYVPNKKVQAKPQLAASYPADSPAQAADQDDPA
jgi:hypothetical protein